MSFEGLSARMPRFIQVGTTQLAYTQTKIQVKGRPLGDDVFIVFINGLGLPQSFWQPTIELMQQFAGNAQNSSLTIHLLTYDRPGQGLSQPPSTSTPEPHDILSSVKELHFMIEAFRPSPDTRVFLIAHSIGVPLARLYIQHHPGTVMSLLAIDSNMANSDFVSLFPNPDSSEFDAERDLPPDTSLQQLREALGKYKRMFHPSVVNPEKLDRSNLASLLPCADRPLLQGTGPSNQVYVNVIGHDPIQFAEESLKMSTKGLTMKYLEPAWQKYNTELLRLGKPFSEHVLIAKGAGHFVQRDRPDYVAEQTWKMTLMLSKLSTEKTV